MHLCVQCAWFILRPVHIFPFGWKMKTSDDIDEMEHFEWLKKTKSTRHNESTKHTLPNIQRATRSNKV